mmetsp:Transcript_12353/g.33866  ORF Transcript_12353/g.33866 Transcript_12353/m.33866 type:complete len:1994 (-) Transcript_12353:112-6093(-)|eukprot:CAMPEP_0171174300 /NCGR_PEP_ID=MMETSP0790-20130122/10657_1 /TAXON_ID=2925 /ORGANISM="Alexandrium catenella, Strain OF101" /LENGTH=1993 /DNA_ID=CAMNT_0011639171 /DNA_START=71 /DNA_END=6052 /DNA_ORIENTATION=+
MSWGGKGAAVPPRVAGAQNWQRNFGTAQAPQVAAAGVKRPVGPQVVSAPAKQLKADVSDAAIIVYSTAERDEIGIRTLVGEYSEGGVNHGRKYYQKTQKIPGHEDINVFLYYWDERDGSSFSGWWFGNQVGGAQVWSRNQVTSMQPPKSGWTIPWDGDIKKELVVVSAAEKQAMDKKEAISRMEARKKEEDQNLATSTVADWEERVQKATESAAEAEIETTTALEHAKEVLQGDIDDMLVMEAQKELMNQAKALAETQRAVALEGVAAQKAPPALKAEMMALGERLRKLQTQVKDELQRLKNVKQIKAQQAVEAERKAEVDARERELEGTHAKQLEEMMPAAMEKVDAAEDEVEKVAIAAAPLQIDTADDLRPVMLQAIKETEQRVRAAQAAIGEARRYISGKLTQVGRFVSTTKKQAVEEFTSLQNKLNEAQSKLTPFKTVRQDYEQRVQAKKLYEELSGKLAGAEIEVEKAAMMTAPLGGDTNEGIKETESALSAAQSALSQCTRLVESKLRSTDKTPGPLRDEIKALQERGKQAQEKLDEVRKTVKETQVRIAADTLLREVSEKVSLAEDELQHMAEAELPFLKGEKIGDEMDTLIAEADQVASKVHTALAEAQTFVAKKLVEVARFTEGPAKTVKEEIDMLQKRLEEGRERLQQFRSSTADRKRTHLLEEVEQKVAAAETEVQRLQEATESLSNIGAAGETVAEGLTETVENANIAERAAQASIVVARKHLLQKTAELKKLVVTGAGAGSELGKLQTRVNTMQQEIAKLRSATKDAEERIRVKQMLSEVAIRLQAAEAEVEKVASVAVPLAQDQPSAEAVERLDKATTSANTKLSATAKLVDVKLKSAQGFLKEELAGMRTRISAAEKKLGDVIKAATEQKERLQTADLIAQALEGVEKAEAEVQKTSESELPFLKGIESLPAAEAIKAIASCEAAALGAQKAISEARTFIVQKLLEAKQFNEGPAEACTKELLALQKKLDGSASKLADLKKDTAERKRKTQMQASGEKINGVEAAVQKLADSMGKFDDSKIGEVSPEDARTLCEEIGKVEHDAQAAVVDARKFLALRLQDAKTFSESLRGPITADLSKLQSRLTQCQVELAKLSKQFTEREQRFVAKKLVEDAQASLKQLQTDLESVSKVAEPLFADDKADLIKSVLVQALVVALGVYSKKTGLKAEGVFGKITPGKTATAEQFSTFVDTLAEATGKDDASFTDEQKSSIFAQVAGKGGKVSLAEFKALLRDHYVCRVSVATADALDDGKDTGVVEVGEGIEVLEEKDDKAGSKRAKCLVSRDGSTAWVTLAEKEGAPNFRAAPPCAGKVESIEAYVIAVHARCSEASQAVERKSVEVASVKQGPLAEIKATLLQLRTKFGAEQVKADALKKRASAAKASIFQQRKEELQKVHEAKCKILAAESVKEGTAAVKAAEEKADKAMEVAKAADVANATIPQLESIKGTADEALQGLAEAKAAVARALERHEAYKGPVRNLLLEARVELTKLTSKATNAEKKLRTATEAVRDAHTKVVKAATKRAREVLRSTARSGKKSVDQLFDDVSKGKGEISEAGFQAFVKGLKGHGLKEEEVALVYKEFGRHGLRKPGFAKALQEFTKCEKDVAITNKLDLNVSTSIRKLEQGELFEVLEGPQEEPSSKVQRVRGKALRDGATGWVTLKSNTGTPFLKAREKPFLWVTREADMLKEFDDKAPKVRALNRDEVLELLEGPREASSSSEVHLKMKACREAAESGWVTLRDAAGTTFASLSPKVYVCRSTIAMTDVFDIASCKVVRKVDVGEALLVVEGQKEQADTDKSIKRLKFKGASDDREGWVTLKGNQGTVYAEPSESHYVVDQETAVREALAESSTAVCLLKAGEIIEGQEAPKEIRPDTKMGVRARSLEDGKSGWVAFAPGPSAPVKPWMPKYTCKAAVALTPALAAKDADAIRQAEVGEVFEAVDGPTLDKSTGLRRIRCATAADGVVGWATLRSSDGTAYLEA